MGRAECLGLVGESGCGKSVTALSILRLVPMPSGRIVGGQVVFEGRDLLALPEREMRRVRGADIAMVFQEPMTSLHPALSVGFQIAEAIRTHGRVGKAEAAERAVEMLRHVQIPSPGERARDYPHQLSGGMRQRVMIAMALACGPKLLIADEPTTALDVTIQAQIVELFQRIRAEGVMPQYRGATRASSRGFPIAREVIRRIPLRNLPRAPKPAGGEPPGTEALPESHLAMLLVTHDLGLVAQMAERVAVMYAGRIVEVAPVRALFEEPRHPYTCGLLRSIPRLGARSGRLAVIPGAVPDLAARPSGCAFRPRRDRAQSRCAADDPQLLDAAAGHRFACWNPARE